MDEADGSKVRYCLYCYKNEHFTQRLAMDIMIDLPPKVSQFNKISGSKFYTIMMKHTRHHEKITFHERKDGRK